jgi:phage gp45-like
MGIDRDMLSQLRHLLRPLATKIANSFARAVVQLADDDTKLQLLQLGVLAGETVDHAEHHQAYGFSSVPLPGAEALVAFPNGDRSHPLVTNVSDRRYRPTGREGGEVTMYNNVGATIDLTKDGDVEVVPRTSGKVLLGSDTASEPPALASELAALKAAIATWAPFAGDGGASLKVVFAAWAVSGATKVKVE